MDPSAWMIWVSINSPQDSFAFKEGQQLSWGVRDGEVTLREVFHLAGSTSSETSGTCGSLIALSRRMSSSSGEGEVPHSSLAGLRREASTISSPLRVIRGLYISEGPMQHHTEHLWGPQILQQRPVVPKPRPGSSFAS